MKELIKIQSRLKAPKKNKNTFGGYNYRSCEDILEAVKPLCHDLNCWINICDEIVEVGGRIYVKATAMICNSEGQTATATAFAREEEVKKGMDAAQITGSASSYARKYALNGLLAIDDTKDADTDEYTERSKHDKTVKPAPAQRVNPPAPRPTITSSQLDDKGYLDRFLSKLYEKKLEHEKFSESFDPIEFLDDYYFNLTEQVKNRIVALFNSYIEAQNNKN